MVIPTGDFSNDSFVAILNKEVEFDPLSKKDEKYVFGTSCFHKHLVTGLVSKYKWKPEMLLVPPSNGCCPAPPRQQANIDPKNPEECSSRNKNGHHSRHLHSHFPDGIGFFKSCPACASLSRRGDMFRRHAESCAPRHRISVAQLILDAEANIFLRYVVAI